MKYPSKDVYKMTTKIISTKDEELRAYQEKYKNGVTDEILAEFMENI